MHPNIKIKRSFIKISFFMGEITWKHDVSRYEVKCSFKKSLRSKSCVFDHFDWVKTYDEACERLHNLLINIVNGHGDSTLRSVYDSKHIRSMIPVVTSATFERKYVKIDLTYDENSRIKSRISTPPGQRLKFTVWTKIIGKYGGTLAFENSLHVGNFEAIQKMTDTIESLPPGLVR